MCKTSTAQVDLAGLKLYVRIGLTLAASIITIAAMTGCAGAHFAPVAHQATQGTPGALPAKVVFIGDSITYLFQAQGLGQPEWSQQPNWIDKGIIGQNSNQIAARFKTDAIDLQPDVIVLLVGTNDVYPGWTLGPSEVPAVWMNAIDSPANVEAMVQMAKDAHIKLILATIPPWSCTEAHCALAWKADPTSSRYQRIDTWNTWLTQEAFDNDLPIVDYHSLLTVDGMHYTSALTIDGVHPSAQGYADIYPVVLKAINQK